MRAPAIGATLDNDLPPLMPNLIGLIGPVLAFQDQQIPIREFKKQILVVLHLNPLHKSAE